ncbi:hypothetical protein Tco_1165098 [Tanacetum coccineum]
MEILLVSTSNSTMETPKIVVSYFTVFINDSPIFACYPNLHGNLDIGTIVEYRRTSFASLDVSVLDKLHFKLENMLRRFIHESNHDDLDYIVFVRSVRDLVISEDPNRRQIVRRKVDIKNLYGNIIKFTMWGDMVGDFERGLVKMMEGPMIISVSSLRAFAVVSLTCHSLLLESGVKSIYSVITNVNMSREWYYTPCGECTIKAWDDNVVWECVDHGPQLNPTYRKVKELLNVTFDETPPPSKTSPLVDDDLDEEEAIKVTKKKNLENDIEDETLEIDEIVNIKESRNHPLEYFIGNLNQRTLRSQAQNQSNFFCFISTIEPKNVNEALTYDSWIVAMQEELKQLTANDV